MKLQRKRPEARRDPTGLNFIWKPGPLPRITWMVVTPLVVLVVMRFGALRSPRWRFAFGERVFYAINGPASGYFEMKEGGGLRTALRRAEAWLRRIRPDAYAHILRRQRLDAPQIKRLKTG